MSVTLHVDFKTPLSVSLTPKAIYSRIGLAITDLAVMLTKHRLWVEANRTKVGDAFLITLKKVRDLANYEQTSEGSWVYEDDNLWVHIEPNADWVEKRTPQLWLDSDGCFADFKKQVETITGQTIQQLGDDQMWALCGPNPDFWDTMPVMEGADRLWALLKPLNPIILTGCPKTDYDLAVDRKRAWWKKHFDHDAVVTCLSKDKAQFIEVQGDILLDDTYRNLKSWRAAGGIGIHHRSVDDTIDQLKNLLII